jgi:hypothetical protein
MKMFIVLIALLSATSLCQITKLGQDKYKDWKTKFGVKFPTQQEEVLRQLNFQKSNDIIEKHNADSKKTYTMGLN